MRLLKFTLNARGWVKLRCDQVRTSYLPSSIFQMTKAHTALLLSKNAPREGNRYLDMAVQGDNSAHVPLISRSSDDVVSGHCRRDMARVGRQPSLQRRLVVQSTRWTPGACGEAGGQKRRPNARISPVSKVANEKCRSFTRHQRVSHRLPRLTCGSVPMCSPAADAAPKSTCWLVAGRSQRGARKICAWGSTSGKPVRLPA